MAEDILGISGHLDISDVVKPIEQLYKEIGKIEGLSKEMATKVQNAFQEVANASEKEIEGKAKNAIKVFSQAFEEAKNSADKNVSKIEATISRLQTQLSSVTLQRSETVIGTKTFDELSKRMESLNTQIHNQQNLLNVARQQALAAGESYNAFLGQVATADSALEAFNATRSLSTTVTAGSAVAHTAVTGAVGAEAAAHGINATAIDKEAKITTEAVDANKQYLETEEEISAWLKELEAKFLSVSEKSKNFTEILQAQGNLIGAIDYFGKNREDYNTTLPQRPNGADTSVVEETKKSTEANKENARSLVQIQTELQNAESEYRKLLGLSEKAGSFRTKLQEYAVSSAYQDGTISEEALQRILKAKEAIEQLKAELSSYKSENPFGDMAKVEEELKRIQKEYDNVQSKVEKLEKTDRTSGQEKELNQLRLSAAQLGAQLDLVREKAQKMRSMTFLGSIRETFDNAGNAVQTFGQKVTNLIEKIPGVKSFEQRLKDISEAANDVKQKIANSSGLQTFSANLTQAKGILSDFGSKISNILTGNGKFQESLKGMGAAFGGLLAPISAATNGLKAMTVQLARMAMTPLGAAIAAIALAFKSLHEWMTKSAEGQRAYAKISAFLGSLMASLSDIAVKLGGYLFHAFADAGAPMNAFAKGMVTTMKSAVSTVINLISGLGNTIKGIFTLDWETFSKGIKKTWEAVKGAGTTAVEALKTSWEGLKGAIQMASEGLGNLDATDLLKAVKGMYSAAQKAAALAERQLDAEKQLSEAKMKEHQLDIAIAEEREKIYTLTGKEKDAQIEKVKNMLKEKYKPQIEAQQTLLDIQKQRNKLHTVSLEQLAKEREAQGAVYAIQAQQASSTRMLVRMQQANLRSMANATKKDANQQKKVDDADAAYNEVEYKNALARAKYQKDIEEQITDARIAAMKEGAAKVEEERNRQFQKELEKLNEQRQAAIQAERNRQKAEFDATEKKVEARGGKAQKWSEDKLDKSAINEINTQFDNLRKLAVERQQNDIRRQQLQSERDFLKQYGSIEQQRLAITQEYEEKINQAIGVGDSYKAASLIQERDSKLKQNSAEELRQNINWDAIFQDITAYDVEFLNSLQTDLEEAIKDGIEKGIDAADLKVFSDKLQEVKNTIIEKTGGLFSSQGLMGGSWFGNLNQAEQKRTQLETIASNRKEEADRLSKVAVAATEERMRAEIRHNDASTPQEREKTWLDLLAARKKEKDASEDSKKADKEAKGAQSALTSFTKQMPIMITDTIIHGVNDNLQSANKMITEWGIGSEDFQEKFAKFAESSQYATAAFDALKNGDIAGVIYNAGEAFNSLGESFGIWSNSNREEVERENERLAMATEINTRAIEKLTKVMEEGSIPDAVNAAERMKLMYNAKQFNALQTMLNNTGMYDGGHSLREDWNDNNVVTNLMTGQKSSQIVEDLKSLLGPYLTATEMQRLNRWAGLDEILRINPQTLAKLYESQEGLDVLNRLTQSITEAQDEGNYNGLSADLLNYIDQFGKDIQLEIDKQLAEKITGTSLESFRDSYKSILMDMRKDTDDFVDDITEKMQQALVADLVDNTFKKELEGIYNQWKDLVKGKSEGTLTDPQFKEQAAAIRARQEEYARQMQEQRDYLAAVTGYDDVSSSEASGSINAAKAMSEDTANELIGRITATQIAVETFRVQQGVAVERSTVILGQSLAEMGYQTAYLASIDIMMQSMGSDVKSIKDGIQSTIEAQGIANMHLANISANTDVLPDMYAEITEMRRKVDTL